MRVAERKRGGGNAHGSDGECELCSGCASEMKEKQDQGCKRAAAKRADDEVPAEIPGHVSTHRRCEIADAVRLKAGVDESSG
jgi:hypothetical protein